MAAYDPTNSYEISTTTVQPIVIHAATEESAGVMTADQVIQLNDASAIDNVDLYVNATSGDDANPGTQTLPVQTFARAEELRAAMWRQNVRIRFAAGRYLIPISDFFSGGPGATASTSVEWLGTAADQFGSQTSTTGTTATSTIATGVSSLFRSGAAASVSAAAGAGQARLTTVTGLTGLTAADCGFATTTVVIDPGTTPTAGAALKVTSTAGFNPRGGFLYCGTEIMSYAGISGNFFVGVARGALGSTVASHTAGAVVSDGSGKNFFFGLATNAGNNGVFQCVSLLSSTSAVFINAQSAVENTGLIYWQDSWRGAFLRYTSASTATCVAVASLVNGDFFTIFPPPGVGGTATPQPVRFEYKVNGSFSAVTGRVTIDVSALTTASEVATATAAAITAATSTSANAGCTGSANSTVVTITPTSGYGVPALTENVANAGFTVQNISLQMAQPIASHGVEASATVTVAGTVTAGDTIVINDGTNSPTTLTWNTNITIGADNNANAVNLAAAINAVAPTSLRVRAAASAGTAVVALTNMIPGSSGNTASPTKTGVWTPTIVTFATSATGVGAPTTTFTLAGAGFSPAPAVGQTFVVEKPGTIFQCTSLNFTGNKTSILHQNIKYIGGGSGSVLIWGNLEPYFDRTEIDLVGGSALTTTFYTNFGTPGVVAANDFTVPFPQQGAGVSKIYIHNGTWNHQLYATSIQANMVLDHLAVNCQIRAQIASLINSRRTTFAFNGPSSCGNNFIAICDGTLLSTDTALVTFDQCGGSANIGIGAPSVFKNSAGYGLLLRNNSSGRIGNLSGTGNVKAGICVDRRSGCTIDAVGSTTIVGIAGNTEFGHETTPNIQTYATIRTADATGTKGFSDDSGTGALAHGNRIDA